MAGAGWRELGPEEWGAHPLNRVWGWMTPIAILLFIEGPMEGALVLSGVVADWEGTRALVAAAGPAWLGWLQLLVPVAEFLLLFLLFFRFRWFPEIYAAIRATAYALAFATGGFAAWDVWWVALAQGLIIGAEVMLVVYLFLGDRPNVLFRRRVRAQT
jgi:hypothetical protein